MLSSNKRLCVAAAVMTLLAASVANGASLSADITASTLPDVTLVEVQPLNFGTTMYVTANGTCTMNASIPGESAQMQYEDDGGATATNFGKLSGTGCINSTGTPGIYRIEGAAGINVTITINGLSPGTDFAFTPAGCIVTYNGAGGGVSSGDTCDSFVVGANISKLLPGNSEESAGGPGHTQAGELVFTIGGTVTIGGTDLTADQGYNGDFTVDVTY